MNITGLCEIRWTKDGLFISGDHTFIYSGNNKGTNGVAIVLDKWQSNINSYNTINDRLAAVTFDTKHVNLNIIQVYAPTSARSNEENELF